MNLWHRWYAWYPVWTQDAGWQWRTMVHWQYPPDLMAYPWAMEEPPLATYRLSLSEATVQPSVSSYYVPRSPERTPQ